MSKKEKFEVVEASTNEAAEVLATPVGEEVQTPPEAVPAPPPSIVVSKFRASSDADQWHAQQLERHLSHFGWEVLLNPEADGELTLFIGKKPESVAA